MIIPREDYRQEIDEAKKQLEYFKERGPMYSMQKFIDKIDCILASVYDTNIHWETMLEQVDQISSQICYFREELYIFDDSVVGSLRNFLNDPLFS